MSKMSKENYISPDVETLYFDMTGVVCQSPLGDTGSGSLIWDGDGGSDPHGRGSDFEWDD